MRRHDGKAWWIGVLGSYVTALIIMIGLTLGGAFSGAGTPTSGRHGDGAHAGGRPADAAMLTRHQGMQDQMRLNASAQMLNLMNADPMWGAMRDAEFTGMLEAQQAEIDRMLGKGTP